MPVPFWPFRRRPERKALTDLDYERQAITNYANKEAPTVTTPPAPPQPDPPAPEPAPDPEPEEGDEEEAEDKPKA